MRKYNSKRSRTIPPLSIDERCERYVMLSSVLQDTSVAIHGWISQPLRKEVKKNESKNEDDV